MSGRKRKHVTYLAAELTQQQLKSLLDYDPRTGRFLWTKNASFEKQGRIAGDVVGGYRRIAIYGATYSAHRLAWLYIHGVMPIMLDHINGDRDDNRIENLRPATHSQNAANARKGEHNTSGAKGVTKLRNGRYTALVTKDGKDYPLGQFDTFEHAKAAYIKCARHLFGEFAHDGERPAPILKKEKAGPLDIRWALLGYDNPVLEPMHPEQPRLDPLTLNPRNLRRLKAKARAQEFLIRQADRVAEKQLALETTRKR